ncbi:MULTISPECIES: response regulator transcription factor [Halomonadaceae]|uniref:Response regulator transcription factor n=1 Tax=Vreelandella piezotolerans TaxID=2609667 RepID=A0ABQ6XDV2_9GAMM|nr:MULTISPECIES: response regulator transcription factor [Halomonas]KAE8439400.1 response regulator transcription factor [Halomonas piezotolerans]MCG7576072.1 response regulator transcription factor [Halomonas sp. MMH1-48]MCG7603149.1 response regulator transcription factor [Halomonas sp. MM17-34]MCG7612399.1 response regulator transcription factor [Halomonas sp. MM17-29]MCG7619280.1 response regulator transcription factor [Halomonas sp. DSH1-27]
MYSLLVADDHPLFRDALQAVIVSGFTDTQLFEADSLAAAMARIDTQEGLDLLLLDLSLPDADGLEGLKTLRETFPWLPVAIVSAHQERQLVLDAITLGAVGYIPKSTPRAQLLAALQQILQGQLYLPADIMRRPPPPSRAASVASPSTTPTSRLTRLTEKQLDVLSCMSQGMSNKQIARELNIAETTVKTHVSAILRKLGASSRVHAIVMAGEEDLSGYLAKRPAR